MIGLLCFALAVLASPFKSKVRLEAENTVLRHQLIVLRRSLPGRVRLPIAPWSATVLFGTVIGFAEDLSVSDAHRVKLSIVFEPFGSRRCVGWLRIRRCRTVTRRFL